MKRFHTIPVGDIEIHSAQETCWCHPIETSHGVIAHNAKDCREKWERQKPDNFATSDGWIIIREDTDGCYCLKPEQDVRCDSCGLVPNSDGSCMCNTPPTPTTAEADTKRLEILQALSEQDGEDTELFHLNFDWSLREWNSFREAIDKAKGAQ